MSETTAARGCKRFILKKFSSLSFPIVGIGASAGGLETFTSLLSELPPDTGMAYVLIQHLDPTHSSFLTQALSKTTQMPIHEIEDGMKTRPNHVYVIPAGSDIGILHGIFTLLPRKKLPGGTHLPIDFFFRALAADRGNQSIGVILSGTGSDGTEGLRTIKAEGGVTLVQDPKSAKFSGMPQNAVDEDVVDFCLPISSLTKELVNLSRHPFMSGRSREPLSSPKDGQDLQKVFVLLRNAIGVDFSEYKPATIKRRLARRMALLKINTLDDYIRLLQDSPSEAQALFQNVLIHVTSFFRDPEVFEKLKTDIYPEIIKNKKGNSPVRIWVCGCATGEEVYSLAISLLEFLGDRLSKVPVQIFGSDISESVIEKARTGFYADAAVGNISQERLGRFFVKVEGGYQINKLVRELCVFVKHDLARDPPFSRLDLVSCRNVLIYFDHALQKRVLSTFHYCLNEPGFLLLGRTENVASRQPFFSTVDKANKIFLRAPGTSRLTFPALKESTAGTRPPLQAVSMKPSQSAGDVAKYADSLLLSTYAPAGVVVNEQMEILQYRGKTGPYIEAPPGKPQTHLLKMVRNGLATELRALFKQAKDQSTTARRERVRFEQDGKRRTCNLVVIPMRALSVSKDRLFIVLFEEVKSTIPVQGQIGSKKRGLSQRDLRKEELKSVQLESELRDTKEYLQSLIEENQRTNEAFNAANEELISGNEELQSMNEELETAKEELQSTNEELTTVNDELQSRNQELSKVNDDLINLLNSVEIPIVILDMHRCVRRFTPRARTIMNLLPGDVGRPIDDIKPNIKVDDLDQQISDVIETLTFKESEVQDNQGKWHRLQIRPYKTAENKIDGVVVSLVDVDTLRRAVKDAEWARDYATSIVEAVQIPLVVLDDKIRVISAN